MGSDSKGVVQAEQLIEVFRLHVKQVAENEDRSLVERHATVLTCLTLLDTLTADAGIQWPQKAVKIMRTMDDALDIISGRLSRIRSALCRTVSAGPDALRR